MINTNNQFLHWILTVGSLILLNACAGGSNHKGGGGGSSSSGGGYYQDDGPGTLSNIDLDRIPNAVVRDEPIVRATTRPYTVLGKRYVPMKTLRPYKARGEISWYGKKYHQRKTSIGETYDMYAMTAAHPTLPLPSYVKVTNLKNRRTVVVRVNDRGPFLQGRILDLSYVAAAKLGYVNHGTAQAEVELLIPGQTHTSVQSTIQPSTLTTVPVKTTSLNTHQTKGYYIQAGAFRKIIGAQALKKKIRHHFDDKTSIVSQQDYYKVWIGPFGDQRELNQSKHDLQQYYSINGFRIDHF